MSKLLTAFNKFFGKTATTEDEAIALMEETDIQAMVDKAVKATATPDFSAFQASLNEIQENVKAFEKTQVKLDALTQTVQGFIDTTTEKLGELTEKDVEVEEKVEEKDKDIEALTASLQKLQGISSGRRKDREDTDVIVSTNGTEGKTRGGKINANNVLARILPKEVTVQ